MNIPCEIWMLVFETIEPDTIIARPSYVDSFVKGIISKTTTEEESVQGLPTFEKEAWKSTRTYYTINSTSRKAAQELLLSKVLLQFCRAPLTEVPGLRMPAMTRTATWKSLRSASDQASYNARSLSLMRPIMTTTGMRPTYLALELFTPSRIEFYSGRDGLDCDLHESCGEECALERLLYAHTEAFYFSSILGTVKCVDLLSKSPKEHLQVLANGLAAFLKLAIEARWEKMGVSAGEVHVLH